MAELNDEEDRDYDKDLKILTDTLRKCFNAEKARFYVADHQNSLFIEIDGLEQLAEREIAEVARPVFNELDLDFDEINLLPLKN